MRASIEFGKWEKALKSWLQSNNHSNLVYLVDQKVNELHKLDFGSAPFYTLQASEENKTVETLHEIWRFLSDQGMDRQAVLVAIGGGLTTDIAGFAASTYMRGIPFVYIPTTLLGMVDASMGGKTAVNFQSYKNRLGSFTEPRLIIQDEAFLRTLPDVEWLSGWAETIKHALIAEEKLWSQCCRLKNLETIKENISEVVPFSINVKERIVDQDFEESSERKKLNFGHTIGHALESIYLIKGKHIPHGLAVAAGMYIETDISQSMGLLPKVKAVTVKEYISEVFPKVEIERSDIPQLIEIMKGDKKNVGAEIDYTLLRQIGLAQIHNRPSLKTIESSIRSYIDGL